MKNIISYLAAFFSLVTAVCVFLPWLQSEASAGIFSFGVTVELRTLNGIELPGGILGLIIALAGAVVALFKIKWAFIGGIINIINGLGYCFGWFKEGISSGNDFFNAGININPAYGLIIFIVSSALFAILSFFLSSKDKEFFTSHKRYNY